jgi:hypothetical protein
MNSPARNFCTVVKVGVAANLTIGLVGLLAPGWLLRTLALDPATPDIWVRFAAWLLILLTLFYLPAARDPLQSPTASWLTVAARWAGVIFFVLAPAALGLSRRYLLFAGFDLLFAVPETLLLARLLRRKSLEIEAPT